MSTVLQHTPVPATEGVRKVEADEGEVFGIAGAHLTSEDWIRCETGDVVILPPNSLHGFFNNTAERCRLLGISTPLHQAFFDAVAAVEKATSLAWFQVAEAMPRVARIGAQYQMYFAPQDISSRVVGRRA